jgi:hypothetical protein
LLHLVDVEIPLNEQNATAHHTNIWHLGMNCETSSAFEYRIAHW